MKRFIYSLVLLLVFTGSFAQEASSEPEIHKINGKEFYIHEVEAGNTLYAISRRYAVPIEVLKKENPRLGQELTIGDRILIPVEEVVRKDINEGLEMDGNFLIHEVQKKNTLYSIAKEYHVEINDIISVNPEIEDGLKKGMKIKIPVARIKGDVEDASYIVPAATNPYVTHMVEPKETLYSLSKRYDVTVDSILDVNNGLLEGLKIGQLINIPIIKTYEDTTAIQVVFDSNAVKQNYKVALLLPLFIDEYEKAKDTTYSSSGKKKKEVFDRAKYGMDFYQGFKLAADSLAKLGMNLQLKIYDTARDTNKVASILKNEDFSSVDLIVGPLYLDAFLLAADFAKANKINIVSPVKQSNKILLGNNFVSKVATSEPVRLKFMGQYMADSLKYDNLFMVYPDHVAERKRIDLIRKNFNQTVELSRDSIRVSFPKEIIWDPANFYQVKSRLMKDRRNTIVVPSDDQAFITQFLTMMSPLHEDYDIKILGLESWQLFDNLEVDYLQELNIHLVVSEYIDHSRIEVRQFEDSFKEAYELIPEKFAYLGYDVGMYYLSLMHEFGLNFELMFLGIQEKMLSRNFEFFKTGIESGYENHSVFLVRYQDYSLKQVQ